jgi:transcriptional regulator with XRE-family HTH domain
MDHRAPFGATVRELRKELGVSLRRFARRIGMSPAYLSKIERDEFAPPAEDKVRAIAEELGQDPDEMLALAGRVSSDLPGIIMRHPREMAALLRALSDAGPKQLRRLIGQAGRLTSEDIRRDDGVETPDLFEGERPGAFED